jgi:hypothetical protein
MIKMQRIQLIILIASVFFGVLNSCKQDSVERTKEQNKQSQTSEHVRRFFSDNSFWNQLIADDPEIDLRTDKWIKMLKQEATGINSIPFDHYRVLKVENPVHKGDARSRHHSYWGDE